MSDEITALDAITDRVLDRGLGALWDRLSPLSAGAVASSAAIVVGCSLLRRVLNPDRDHSIRWVGLVILAPVALWLLAGARDADTSEPMPAEEPGQPAGPADLTDVV